MLLNEFMQKPAFENLQHLRVEDAVFVVGLIAHWHGKAASISPCKSHKDVDEVHLWAGVLLQHGGVLHCA